MKMELSTLSRIPIEDILAAQGVLDGVLMKTPLIPLNLDTGTKRIYLKLENLQPVGSFKIRGAYNKIYNIPKTLLGGGVYTCSAGNFAQGLAWGAQKMDIDCTIITPDNAPLTKIQAIERLGGKVIKVPYDEWWNVMVTRKYEGLPGHFVHPVCEREVIAGNGTIGLEILEDLPQVDTVIGPFGGGGHLCGISSAIKATNPGVKVIACEVETAAPLTASFKAKEPITLKDHKSSFVDGMGGKSVFKEMWNMVSSLIDDTAVLSLNEICDAVRLLVERNHVVAEGAGAAPVAAALRQEVKGDNIVCVISGGNIDNTVLTTILQGNVP